MPPFECRRLHTLTIPLNFLALPQQVDERDPQEWQAQDWTGVEHARTSCEPYEMVSLCWMFWVCERCADLQVYMWVELPQKRVENEPNRHSELRPNERALKPHSHHKKSC